MATNGIQSSADGWNEMILEIQTELDRNRCTIKDIDAKLDQSRLEVNKLAQKNVSMSSNLQRIQSRLEAVSRKDLIQVYDLSLDTQQRLFRMHGQVEKLESDHKHIARHIAMLEKILQMIERGVPTNRSSIRGANTVHTVEMMIQSQEAERQRLSRQMHDGPAQALSNFILQAEIAMRLFSNDLNKAHEELENLKLSAMNTFKKVRDFIFDLRPMMLDDLGLVPTIKRYLETLNDQNGLDIQISLTGKERRFASYKEVMVFRGIQELTNNALQHSQASHLMVQLDMGEMIIKATVDDDGLGFEVESLEDKPGMGLRVIRDRVEMLGGHMQIDSKAGQGTLVTFEIPASEDVTIK